MNVKLKKLKNEIGKKFLFHVPVNLLLSRARMSRRKRKDIRNRDPIHRMIRRVETASMVLTDSFVLPAKIKKKLKTGTRRKNQNSKEKTGKN